VGSLIASHLFCSIIDLSLAFYAAPNTVASNLVSTTFIGREYEWVDHITGEIKNPPITIGYVQYPDGDGELYGVARGQGKPNPMATCVSSLFNKPKKKHWATKKLRCLPRGDKKTKRRARSNVRRKCRYYGLSVMVTLAFPSEGVHDYNRALRLVQDFIHDHGSVLHLNGKWLAVPELHPGGHGWHWHILVAQNTARRNCSF